MTDTGAAPRIAVPLALDPRLAEGLDPRATVHDLAGATMGTTWRVRFAAPGDVDRAAVERAIVRRLDGLVGEMSHWSEATLLARFNRAAAGTWTKLPPDFAAVMVAGRDVATRSGGAFDPAIGRLTDLWGLGPDRRDVAPDAAAIDAALAESGWRRLALVEGWLHQPGGLWLDLSGTAKGHAVDAVADLLAAMRLRHALVEIGGECVGRGMRPDGDPWWVDLETPPGHDLAPLRVALHGLAVATSGDYVRGLHTLDPRTGRPAGEGAIAASVLHARCADADAWASALCVLPPTEARALAERERLAARIIERDGSEWLSPALRAML